MSESSMPPPVPPPQEFCRFCGAQIPPSGYYCPRCGAMGGLAAQQGVPPAGARQMQSYMLPLRRLDFRLVVKTLSSFLILIYVVLLVLGLCTLVYGANLVIPDILDTWEGYTFILVVPFFVELFTISGSALLAYYLLLIVAILISCIWILVTSIRMFGNELTTRAKSRVHSPLFDTVGLLFATLFFSFLVGVLVNPPEEDLSTVESVSELLFTLANASVWEELIVRVLLLGLPLLFVDLVRKKRQTRWYGYILGGNIKIGYPEAALVVISSVIFGMGHFAGGWGAWKIAPATVGGLALGFLFLKFGIAASITMHFGTNYMAMPAEVFESDGLIMLDALIILMAVAAGLGFFAYYTTRVAEFMTGKRYFEPAPPVYPRPWTYPEPHAGAQTQWFSPQAPPVVGQDMGYPTQYTQTPPPRPVQSWFTDGYICPSCGHTQARWVNGQFQCLRCGRLS